LDTQKGFRDKRDEQPSLLKKELRFVIKAEKCNFLNKTKKSNQKLPIATQLKSQSKYPNLEIFQSGGKA
jgi:hypothetical protein